MALYTTTIDLLRHGEPEGGRLLRGVTDDPLTDHGWQQMLDVTCPGDDAIPWTRVVYSPLGRCRAFGEWLAGQYDVQALCSEHWREMHFGDWEGRSVEELMAQNAEGVQAFWQNPAELVPPNGEPMLQFRDRVLAAWDELLDAMSGEHILLVTHGGVIRVLLCDVLGLPLNASNNFAVPYACLSQVKVYREESGTPWYQLAFHAGSYRHIVDAE